MKSFLSRVVVESRSGFMRAYWALALAVVAMGFQLGFAHAQEPSQLSSLETAIKGHMTAVGTVIVVLIVAAMAVGVLFLASRLGWKAFRQFAG